MFGRQLTLLILACLLAAPLAAAQAANPLQDQVVEHPATLPDRLERIRAIHPEFVTVDTFGESLGGLPLWNVDVHHPDADPAGLPVYYLDGNHHGNEQYGSETVLIFLEELVEWTTTEEGAERLAEVRVVVSPMINPDGTATDKRGNHNNVDLNRNYAYHWGLYGTSDSPASFNYRGSAPASEPEVQANSALLRELHPEIYFSMHTGSHDIVLPWRADEDGEMPDWPIYEKFLAGLKDASGLDYRDPSGAGESISYGYGALGAVSLIPEVSTTQFQPAATESLREILKEEVALCWYGLEVLEKLGGHLAIENGTLVNDGWGPAINVTLLDAAGRTLTALPNVAAGEPVDVPAGAASVTYERRAQGDLAKPVWTLDLQAAALAAPPVDGGLDVPAPAPLALVGLAGLAGLLRRRD